MITEDNNKPINTPSTPCPHCHGTGTVMCDICKGKGRTEGNQPCRTCNGKGEVACPACNGSGRQTVFEH